MNGRSLRGIGVALATACATCAFVLTALAPAAPAAAQTLSPSGATGTSTGTSLAEQQLYGNTQWAAYPITNPVGSVSPGFDGVTSSIAGPLSRHDKAVWTWGGLQRTTLQTIRAATLEVRLSVTGWEDDELVLEYTTDNWQTVHWAMTLGPNDPPSATLSIRGIAGIERVIKTAAQANSLQVRFRADKTRGPDTMTLEVDQVRLVVRGQ